MSDSTEKLRYFSGPLNLCRETKRADTVMGTQLLLTDNTFDALDMLVSADGEFVTFEQLYDTVWGGQAGSVSHEEAQAELFDLIDQVNTTGEGFMIIEFAPAQGYSFQTHWGHNWQSQAHNEDTFALPENIFELPEKPKKTDRRLLAILLTGAVAAAAVVVMILTSMMNDLTPDVEIYEEQVPLVFPDFIVPSCCLEEGGCGNPDECTGEGICADTEEDPDAEAGPEGDEDSNAESDPEGEEDSNAESDPEGEEDTEEDTD